MDLQVGHRVVGVGLIRGRRSRAYRVVGVVGFRGCIGVVELFG